MLNEIESMITNLIKLQKKDTTNQFTMLCPPSAERTRQSIINKIHKFNPMHVGRSFLLRPTTLLTPASLSPFNARRIIAWLIQTGSTSISHRFLRKQC
jgi:hypothetical protein